MHYILYFLFSFTLSLIFTPIVRRLAVKYKLISYPRVDRWHKQPTAILGGVGIYLAAIIAVFSLGLNLADKNAQGLLFGATFLFIVGLADDKFHFAPYTKLFTQIIAGCIAIFFGIVLDLPVNNLLVIPLTLFWIIGITNSFNLLDNIDGLAAGIAAISAFMIFITSLIFSNNPLGVYALVLSGACLGFLPYNFNPAKIFMGDSGSMFLGYSLAVISIGGETARQISGLLVTLFVPVLILSVPIFDTIFVMIVRKLQGKKIFEGGKDHTSHRLLTLGLSPRKTVLLLYLVSVAFGLIAILYSKLNIFIISAIAFLAVTILLIFAIFLSEGSSLSSVVKERRGRRNSGKEKTILLGGILLYKRRIVEVLLDFIFICLAYYSAYFLRFEGVLLQGNIHLIKESLVWIILINMSVFFIFGLYRGMWKYISISDFFTIFKVVSLGSIISILFLTMAFRFREYSRAVFFINWLILLLLIMGSRFLFRIIGEFFSRVHKEGDNILIFGAGDTGEMVIREIKRNKVLNFNPVGFIDDDPLKIGNKIQGIRVLGSREKIVRLAQEYNIKEVLIAIPSIDIVEFSEIAKICQDCGLAYRKIKGILDRDDPADVGKN